MSNHYEPPMPESKSPVEQGSEGMKSYNVVSDTVTGANVRWKDNVYQAIAILICILLGVGIGALLSPTDRVLGMVACGFLGMLVGLFGSGIFIMIYRAVRHMRGKHD